MPIVFFTISVHAQANTTMSIQGKIVNQSDGTNVVPGTPTCILTGADTCDIRINVYSALTGGTLLWYETHSNVELGDNSGIFSLALNSICNNWTAPTAGGCGGTGINWGTDPTVFFEIHFDDDGNGDFVTPEIFARSELTTVPYAYYADVAGSVSGGLDTVYDNDTDQVLGIDNTNGLKFLSTVAGNIVFDLQSTGDIVFEDNNVTFLTISDTGGFAYILDATDNPEFNITNAGTGDINFDLTSTGDFTVSENGLAFFTMHNDNSITYSSDDATDVFTINNGNLAIVNSGTPDLSLNGLDFYVEGTLEVDSNSDFGGNININDNQIQSFRVENLATAPTCDNTVPGKIYHNTANNNTYVCNGTNWIQVDQTPNTTVLGEFYDGTGGTNANSATPTAIPWNNEVRKDSGITHDTVTNNTRVYLDKTGWYKISYNISHENQSNSRKNVRCRIRLNGTTFVIPSDSYSYSRNQVDEWATNTTTTIFETTATNTYYEVVCNGEGSEVGTVAANTVANQSWTTVEKTGGTALTAAVDLDLAYDNDTDKRLNIDNVNGLEFLSSTAGNIIFDLQSTGDFVIEDSGSALFVVLDSGEVGIGTDTPLAGLDINFAGTAAAPALIWQNDSNTGIFHPAADEIAFSANGAEQIRITGNGLRFYGKTSDPTTPQEGDMWFRSDVDNFKIHADGRTQEIRTVAIAQVYETGTTTFNTSTAIDWDGTSTTFRFVDATYTHTTATNPSRVTINDAGLYRISYNISWDTTVNARRTSTCRFYVNGSLITPGVGSSHAYSRNSTDDWETNSAEFMYAFSAADYYEIRCENTGTSGNITTLTNESWTLIELIRRN